MTLSTRTRSEALWLVIILGILNALTPFSIDLYLPAFTQIAKDLDTSVAHVALSVSMYFVGFAVGQIIYGPLLDQYGRKRPIYAGLALYIAASIGCMLSTSIEMLLAFRCMSALGGAAASVGAITMVRDLFPVKDSAKIFSNLMLVLSVSPLFAPTVGSLVITFWGWRSLFAILTVLALIDVALIAFALPETFVPDSNGSISLRSILKSFSEVFKNKQFRVFTFAGSLSFAGLFVFVAGSPSIFMEGFGVGPKIYGAIFATLAMGMIGGGQLNHVLVRLYGSHKVFEATIALQTLTGLSFFVGAMFGYLGLFGTMAHLFVILVCAGIGYPNAAAIALEPFSQNAGSAAALLGFLQLGLGSAVSAGVGFLDMKGTLPTALVIAISTCVAIAILLLNRSVTGSIHRPNAIDSSVITH